MAREARERGLDFLTVPENYYDDLLARFGLDADRLAHLSELDLLYDREAHGEFVHFYTGRSASLLRGRPAPRRLRRLRRPNAPVRLASQHSTQEMIMRGTR